MRRQRSSSNFSYYKEAYSAVLGGLVGEYEIQESEGGPYVKKYGLKAFPRSQRDFRTVIMMILACREAMDIKDSI